MALPLKARITFTSNQPMKVYSSSETITSVSGDKNRRIKSTFHFNYDSTVKIQDCLAAFSVLSQSKKADLNRVIKAANSDYQSKVVNSTTIVAALKELAKKPAKYSEGSQLVSYTYKKGDLSINVDLRLVYRKPGRSRPNSLLRKK